MKKLATIAAALLIAGCASTGEMAEEKMGGAMDFDSLAKEAAAAIKKASSAGGEWRDSEKFLKQAKSAAKAGDMDKAMKLVNKAKSQGEMAYSQAKSQKDAGPWLF